MKPLRLLAADTPFAPALAFAQAAKQIPLRDFFRNPEQTGHQLSRGRQVPRLARPLRAAPQRVRASLRGRRTVRVSSETARSIAGYSCKGDRIIYAKDFGGDENFHIVSVDFKGGDLKDLTPGEKVKANVVDILYDDPDHLILSHNRRDAKVFDVYREQREDRARRSSSRRTRATSPGGKTDHAGKAARGHHHRRGEHDSLLYRERRRTRSSRSSPPASRKR
jgi:hypothetical protein